jgi:hypothetical protein
MTTPTHISHFVTFNYTLLIFESLHKILMRKINNFIELIKGE